MKSNSLSLRLSLCGIVGFMLPLLLMAAARAATLPVTLPGAADAGRIEQREGVAIPGPSVLPPTQPAQIIPMVKPPDGSDQIKITITEMHTSGMTVFTDADIRDIYAPYLGHEVTLDTVWKIADQLTARYRDAGYFLSRAVVPEQNIQNGQVLLHVVEGYVGEIKFADPLADNRIVRRWLARLKDYRPLKAEQLESVLLHLKDLPGVNLHAVLEPMQAGDVVEGAVRLVLESKPTPLVSGNVSFDNFGSRYLGPYEAQATLQAVFLPTQRTTLSGLSSLPWDEVKYGSLKHEVALFPSATLEVYGGYTNAAPGYTLKPEEIKSNSTSLGMAFGYNFIRQRSENLNGRVAFDGQNTRSDILGTLLTRDAVRALRLGLDYQIADNWLGTNGVNGTVSHGLPILGASKAGQEDLSREGAKPDFTKFVLGASRLQGLSENWGVLAAFSGQIATGPLYTSEQFGYGGQAFGRAYDNSEITGDDGMDGSAELRYSGFGVWHHFQPVPYGFYDIGSVWNLGQNQTTPYASGSSAGGGFRLVSDLGLSSDLGVALPLTRAASDPIYGSDKKSPRYYMQISYGF